MGLMEPGCTRRDFGRDVQPAVPNRPRCWSLVGSTFGAISRTGAESTQHRPARTVHAGQPNTIMAKVEGGSEISTIPGEASRGMWLGALAASEAAI